MKGRKAPAKKHLPRKKPSQARSQERVRRILDAAAEVVEEVGYDAATTNQIAARAGCAIGSLYQFFPNKAALMHALALLYVEELRALLGRVIADVTGPQDRPLDWRESVSRIVDAFAHFHHHRAGFHAVFFGGLLSADLLQTAIQCGRDMAQGVEPLLAALAPGAEPERRLLVARVATELTGALLILSTERKEDPAWVASVLDQTKLAVIAYLERALISD